jgi:hypothetical protein
MFSSFFSTPIILFIIFFFVVVLVISTYVLFKVLQISMEYNNVFFYQYNKKCQKLLDAYGDCKIQNVYVVRQPFDKVVSFLFNVITLFSYNKYLSESMENNPYHPALIFEILVEKPNNVKFILVEKNNCINISETFVINKNYEYKRIDTIPKNKHTLLEVLSKTRKRLGDKKYFNWNMHTNNCQIFCQEILLTLCQKQTHRYDPFIFRNKMLQYYSPSDFTLHIVNCLFVLRNFIEKYIFDNNIFY